jgi:hypothetical protein
MTQLDEEYVLSGQMKKDEEELSEFRLRSFEIDMERGVVNEEQLLYGGE